MAVLSLNDRLARNENSLAGKIYKTSIPTSIWNTELVRKEEWINGLSDVQRVLTVERNLPANIDDWNAVNVNVNANSCAPLADIIPRGNTTRTYSLVQKALESERICVNDTRNAWETNEQIAKSFANLRAANAYVWKRRGQLEYTRIAENKVIAAPGTPFNDTAFPAIAPTSVLTQGLLNVFYQTLLQMGAAEEGGSIGRMDGRPQFLLITDMASSDSIMREDGNINAFLWNNKRVTDLLGPLGVDRSFRGFTHVIDTHPRRYTFNGGVWAEVEPWEEVVSDDGGKRRRLRAEYIKAPYTDSVIYLPNVMTMLHPKPISTVGSGTSFDPQKYVGDFKWKNVENVDSTSPYYNPDRAWGFYRALLMSATKPIHPEFGTVIRHLRCFNDVGAKGCPEAAVGASSDLGSGDGFWT